MKADAHPEKEALAWAIGYFRVDPKKLTKLTKKASKLFEEDLNELFADLTEEKIDALVDRALKGDELSIRRARSLAIELIYRPEPLCNSLRMFTSISLDDLNMNMNKKRPGRKRNDIRDQDILYAIKHIVEEWGKWGIKATRSLETKRKHRRESAASIVVEALKAVGVHLEEGTVNGIWDRRYLEK